MTAQVIGTSITGHNIWGGTLSEMNAAVKPALEQFQVIGGNLYESNGSVWNQVKSGGTSLVTNPNGTMNGGWKVADMNNPARDRYQDFFFGADDALSAALTAAAANNGLWVDQSYVNVNQRSIVIINGDAAPSFSYTVEFSRNGLGSSTDDTYTVVALTAATSRITRVNLPASLGYEGFVRLVITPDAGQTGAKLTFKAYLAGRGG